MRLSIRSKLVSGFALILIMMIILGWRGIVVLNDIKETFTIINTEELIPAKMTANANIALIMWNRATLNHVLATNMQEMNRYEQIMLEQKAILLKLFQELTVMEHLSERGKDLLKSLQLTFDKSKLIHDRIVSLSRAGQKEKSRQLIQIKLRPIIDRIDVLMSEFINLQELQLNRTLKTTEKRYRQEFNRIVLIIASAIFLSLIIAFYLSKMILRNVNEMVRGAKIASQGELKNGKVAIKSKDEFGYLGLVFNQMLESLEQSIAEQNKQREKFISVLIHDLKGPLMPVLGFTRRLLQGKAKSEADRIDMLKAIQESSQNILKIIESTSQDLKNKIATEHFNPKPVTLNDIVMSVVFNYTHEIECKGIECFINDKDRQQWNEMKEISLEADPIQLKTLVENLIGNAIKYAKKTINVEFNKKDSNVYFIVSDDGPGIPEVFHEKIFDEYYQTPGSKKGTGIGLYSVKKVVENHKGDICVHSTSNEGSRFEVIFPVVA